ncbi:hypothetical protein C0Q93_11570 [Streptomyces albidoflavus]|uniref:hypothetical protein n=1 Tax=Streptomyces albidoflavus TaxID=1886 RepID=UPI0010211B90|nr:hypothetical protein [Streptomyces albidoflavus]RZE24097.1 hypothetical protein C0Q93_11570 [Streptomyces albidoflavus]RZE44319.1 hypothetical protein C0Q94_11580 [Streptomyces albidoflavus]
MDTEPAAVRIEDVLGMGVQRDEAGCRVLLTARRDDDQISRTGLLPESRTADVVAGSDGVHPGSRMLDLLGTAREHGFVQGIQQHFHGRKVAEQ